MAGVMSCSKLECKTNHNLVQLLETDALCRSSPDHEAKREVLVKEEICSDQNPSSIEDIPGPLQVDVEAHDIDEPFDLRTRRDFQSDSPPTRLKLLKMEEKRFANENNYKVSTVHEDELNEDEVDSGQRFQSSVLANLNLMRQCGSFCDVVFLAGGKKFYAHKAVMAACSDFCREKFAHQAVNEQSECDVVAIDDVSATAFKCLLDFVYSGEINLTEELAKNLQNAAHYLRIKELAEKCSVYLRMKQENCQYTCSSEETVMKHDRFSPPVERCATPSSPLSCGPTVQIKRLKQNLIEKPHDDFLFGERGTKQRRASDSVREVECPVFRSRNTTFSSPSVFELNKDKDFCPGEMRSDDMTKFPAVTAEHRLDSATRNGHAPPSPSRQPHLKKHEYIVRRNRSVSGSSVADACSNSQASPCPNSAETKRATSTCSVGTHNFSRAAYGGTNLANEEENFSVKDPVHSNGETSSSAQPAFNGWLPAATSRGFPAFKPMPPIVPRTFNSAAFSETIWTNLIRERLSSNGYHGVMPCDNLPFYHGMLHFGNRDRAFINPRFPLSLPITSFSDDKQLLYKVGAYPNSDQNGSLFQNTIASTKRNAADDNEAMNQQSESRKRLATSFDMSTRESDEGNASSNSSEENSGSCAKKDGDSVHRKKQNLKSGESGKPYSCPLCDANFNRPANLKTHMRIHSGEKPYKCETCSARFVQVAHLRAHVLIHTGEKPYPCNVCGTSFRHLQTLKSHLRIHTGEKPYSCEKCCVQFRHKSQLRLHLRTKHGIQTNTKKTYKQVPGLCSADITALIKRAQESTKNQNKPVASLGFEQSLTKNKAGSVSMMDRLSKKSKNLPSPMTPEKADSLNHMGPCNSYFPLPLEEKPAQQYKVNMSITNLHSNSRYLSENKNLDFLSGIKLNARVN